MITLKKYAAILDLKHMLALDKERTNQKKRQQQNNRGSLKKKIESFQKRREEIAFQYNEAFKNLPVTLPAMPMNTDKHSWHLYVLQLHDSLVISRDRFIELMYENSVGCSVHYIPLHLHPYWRETYNLTPEMFPVSQHAYEQSVSLPIYSKMKMEDVERVVTAVKTILTNG